ncbi:hypothetical protein P7S69_003060 [Escherichia coli]|nr:hypothetical protein [Escherichia coli]EKR0293242.1 hypothetical protein [Escherichia coli]MBC0317868.1 hypothetical protein [Escherichia coli]MBC0332373.1 hypothetical protein [Escherichia coli]MBC0887426.1 hypothetical protein [Escherichia coli]MBC1073037.1 hypothetical protein [Escherichia coli]
MFSKLAPISIKAMF